MDGYNFKLGIFFHDDDQGNEIPAETEYFRTAAEVEKRQKWYLEHYGSEIETFTVDEV